MWQGLEKRRRRIRDELWVICKGARAETSEADLRVSLFPARPQDRSRARRMWFVPGGREDHGR